MLMGFSFRAAYWLYEPYFSRVEIDIVYFGAIFSGYNVIAALASKYLAQRWTDQRRVLLGLGFLHAFTYLLQALCFAAFSPLVGLSLDAWGVVATYGWMGTITLVGTLALALWWTKRNLSGRC